MNNLVFCEQVRNNLHLERCEQDCSYFQNLDVALLVQHWLTQIEKGLRVIEKIICDVQLLNRLICNCFAK
jgi:hypothetical protein